MKHRDDIANAKLIPSILPAYLPPLSGAINRDSVPRDFEYALVTAYLLKEVRAVHADQDKIAALKFSDFNLGDRKVYNMLAPHKYLMRTKGKNSNITPQSWTQNLAQSTLLNVMKILHFGRHQEVNACIKLLLSFYHGGYLWLNCRITVDPTLINQITGLSMQGPRPTRFLPHKDHGSCSRSEDKGYLQRCREGHMRLQGSLYPERRSAPSLSTDRREISLQEPAHPSNQICSRPRREVRGGPTHELGKYLVNQLELDCREAKDQGYEFHFSWILILITFIAWEMPKGATFPNIEPFEPLVAKFSTLWYSSDMNKQWQ
jgi:hypothetical protein